MVASFYKIKHVSNCLVNELSMTKNSFGKHFFSRQFRGTIGVEVRVFLCNKKKKTKTKVCEILRYPGDPATQTKGVRFVSATKANLLTARI